LGSQGSLLMKQKHQSNSNNQIVQNFETLQSLLSKHKTSKQLAIQYYSFEGMDLLFCPSIALNASEIRDTTGAGNEKKKKKETKIRPNVKNPLQNR
jgi:hypothetical protein